VTEAVFGKAWHVPDYFVSRPLLDTRRLVQPACVLILSCDKILVIGIRESAASNTLLVVIKLSVVIFVIIVGYRYIDKANWTGIPYQERKTATQILVGDIADDQAKNEDAVLRNARNWAELRFGEKAKEIIVNITESGQSDKLEDDAKLSLEDRAKTLKAQALAFYMLDRTKAVSAELLKDGTITETQAKERNARAQATFDKDGPKRRLKKLAFKPC